MASSLKLPIKDFFFNTVHNLITFSIVFTNKNRAPIITKVYLPPIITKVKGNFLEGRIRIRSISTRIHTKNRIIFSLELEAISILQFVYGAGSQIIVMMQSDATKIEPGSFGLYSSQKRDLMEEQ